MDEGLSVNASRSKTEEEAVRLYKNLSYILDQLKKLHNKDTTGKEVTLKKS